MKNAKLSKFLIVSSEELSYGDGYAKEVLLTFRVLIGQGEPYRTNLSLVMPPNVYVFIYL